MRLLYVIESLAPGGAETSLAALTPHFIAAGIELQVAYFYERPGVRDRLETGGAVVDHLGAGTGRRDRAQRVRAVIDRRRPDLVHTTLFEADLAGRLAARRAHVPVVSSLVNLSYGPEHRARLARSAAAKLALAHAADAATAQVVRRFHANSHETADVMAKRLHVRRDTIDVVWRGRDAARLGRRTDERRSRVRAALGIDPDTALVLAVGRQEPQKAFEVLLQAMATLHRSLPGAVALVAGMEGSDSARLADETSRLGLGRTVQFLGHRVDVADLLGAADVLAFPSRWEGLPGTLIEALALECPIVASDLLSVREVVGDHGAVLVPPGDPAALARGLESVLVRGRGEWEAVVAAGRERFLERFTIERSAAGMLAFYERALGRSVS